MIWIFFFFSFFINAAVQDNFKAAGILIYTKFQDNNYFLLGRDKNKREWSDFGGNKQNQETAMQTAFRECKQKSGLSITLDSHSKFVVNQETDYKMFLAFLDYSSIIKHFESYSYEQTFQNKTFLLMPFDQLFNQCELVWGVYKIGWSYTIRKSFFQLIQLFNDLQLSSEFRLKVLELYPVMDPSLKKMMLLLKNLLRIALILRGDFIPKLYA